MKELLVPVGSYESLIVAIRSGADAVYLGGKKFGARAYAANFSDAEMVDAIKLCHLYGVKIYVTVNTLVYEYELNDVIAYAKFLHENGVDALIVQDIGLISILKNTFPNLEIHASTQVHNVSNGTLKFLASLGVSRVVLARELSLKEIEKLDTSLELECFIHGALCISYSGQCLFSSCLLNRSGNRGMCAQVCRLPYRLLEDDKFVKTEGEYLLSPRELNTSEYFNAIMESNIKSLKIEGRMKSPEYVGCVTKLYRNLINSYYKTGICTVDKELLSDLNTIFNREYTKGFLFQATNEELMNIKSSNHLGSFLGNVSKIDKKYIYIHLENDLNQGDGIRFMDSQEGMICNYLYNTKGMLINSAKKGETVLVDNRFKVDVNERVNKTLDKNIVKKYTEIPDKVLDVTMSFKAVSDKALELSIKLDEDEIKVNDGIALKALKTPTSSETIVEHLSKLGGTPFRVTDIALDVENNLFINIKDLNNIRRKAVSELIKLRENKKKEVIIKPYKTKSHFKYHNEEIISVLVRNEAQLQACLDLGIKRIYVLDKDLYQEYASSKNVYFRTSRVNNNYKNPGLITELGALENGGIGDYFLNVTNHETINVLSKYLDIVTLSIELSDEEIENIMKKYEGNANIELVVHSNIELMITKYCPINRLANKEKPCQACKKHKYYLVDRNNKKYPIITDSDIHLTHILNYDAMDKIDRIAYYRRLGIKNFRIELLNENASEVKELLKRVK